MRRRQKLASHDPPFTWHLGIKNGENQNEFTRFVLRSRRYDFGRLCYVGVLLDMKRPAGCVARQYSDQMQCARCGLTWDVNDPEPPECGLARKPETGYVKFKTLVKKLKGQS